MKIYTKSGDAGETGLFDGTRVAKSDPRVEAYGDIDELNAWIGLARSRSTHPDLNAMLDRLQRDLFAMGSMLADPAHKISTRVNKAAVTPEDVQRLEHWIDALDAKLPQLRRFILAGGADAGALLHLARVVCRRAERRVVALGGDVDAVVLTYVNRLSDLLFVMARSANARAGSPEPEW